MLHPADSVVDFVQHLGVVSFLRETVFIGCSCSVHQILFHMIWETISTTEQHNHSSGMLKQFVAQPHSGMHKQFVAKKPFLLFSEKFVCKNEAFCIFGRHLSMLGKSHLLRESRWFFHGY